MAERFPTMVGSGTIPYLHDMLHTSQGGNWDGTFDPTQAGNGHGQRIGEQVIVANFEDVNSSAAWATSGVEVGAVAVKIVGPDTNPLPRCREILLSNNGGVDVFLGSGPGVSPSGYPLKATPGPEAALRLPLLHNNEVWAITAGGTTPVHFAIIL